jgi:hypothetical protein
VELGLHPGRAVNRLRAVPLAACGSGVSALHVGYIVFHVRIGLCLTAESVTC